MRKSPTMAAFSMALAIVLPQPCLSAKAFAHGWSTVSDVIAMHGKYKHLDEHPPQKDIEFIARNYPSMVTTGCGCSSVDRGNPSAQGLTIEESVLATAARIKEVNAEVKVGMYWRTDVASELAECSGFAKQWAAHPEYYLKNDTGGVVGPKHYYDYLNPAAADFFQKVLFNVTTATLPSGKPILDFLYLDGGGCVSKGDHVPGIKGPRSQQLIEGKHKMISALQRQLDAQGHGQILVLNAMDDVDSAQEYVATGAAGAMFDHWSILGFLNRSDGSFNKTKMDEGFRLVTSSKLANITTQIKGWPGPIIKQEAKYPADFTQPNTTAARLQIAQQRFNSELALFLIVATETDFWVYSWFWGWYDSVGGNASSTVPEDFFPQARCKLGAPVGPMIRHPAPSTGIRPWIYTRKFAYADVYVDLNQRNMSKVNFHNCNPGQ